MLREVGVRKGTFSYEIAGSGPCLLVPRCNFPWTDFGLHQLEGDFTVLTVSPLGYGEGGRLSPPDEYSAGMLASDLLSACSDAGFSRFSVFGYSFTGAVGAWLAHVSDRVDAVLSGGFPLAGDYRRHLAIVERHNPEAAADQADEGSVEGNFDLVGLDTQAAAFAERGLPFGVFEGLTHGGMLEHLDLVLTDVIEWLKGAADTNSSS
jgi:pimeloyl-ACP methyl ester carboxylesterase